MYGTRHDKTVIQFFWGHPQFTVTLSQCLFSQGQSEQTLKYTAVAVHKELTVLWAFPPVATQTEISLVFSQLKTWALRETSANTLTRQPGINKL